MCSFPDFEPVCCSVFISNDCFLTCIQVSQEAGKVVWYSHLFKNFPKFIGIHTVKGFSIINEAEVNVFLEFPCFFYDQTDTGNLISGSSAFSKSSLTYGISWFMYCWSLAWRISSITLLACEMTVIVQQFLALPFFGIEMKTDLFQSVTELCLVNKYVVSDVISLLT